MLCCLNNKIIEWYLKQIGHQYGKKGFLVSNQYVEQLPIYSATPEQQEPFIEKSDQMLEINKEFLNEINSFKEWLTHIFKVEKLSKKLEKYYELSLDEFLAELKKRRLM